MIDRRPCSDWSSLIDIGVSNRARRSRAQCSQRAANRRRVIVTASRRFRGVPLRMIGGMRHLARDQASCHIPDVIQDVAAKGENRQYPHKGLRDSILEEFHHRLKTSTERFGDVNGRLRFRGASPGRSSCFFALPAARATTASCGRGLLCPKTRFLSLSTLIYRLRGADKRLRRTFKLLKRTAKTLRCPIPRAQR